MDTAWNWLTNTQLGSRIFAQKVLTIVGVVQKAIKDHPTLPPLTQAQMEGMALLQYGGFVTFPNGLNDQYYSPQPIGGKWEWALNNNVSEAGQQYVTTVYTPPVKNPFPTKPTCP